MTQKNRVFGTSLVGGYGVEIKIEADITVLVTYRRSQENKRVLLERTFQGNGYGRHDDAIGGIQGIVIYRLWHIHINIQDRQ